ncbi:MAG: helix-turn-helix transcriptional regulator [Clostridia bacterium]|nr:helix-turn-helix transcriptional regulator [Clostridia bacterium]
MLSMRFLSCKSLIKCAAAKDGAICIAEEVGFESIFYFSRVFKAETGVSPFSFARK